MESNKNEGLSINDWITFLGNEKAISYGTILGLGAAFLAFLALVNVTLEFSKLVGGIIAGILLVLLFIYCAVVVNKHNKRKNSISGLLAEIMDGTLNDPNEVRKSWKTITDDIPKSKK